jgi:hypothetical protein
MTILNLTKDAGGRDTFLRRPSTIIKSGVLAAGVEQHFTIPSEFPRYNILFSYSAGASVWISINGTAVVPTSTIADTNSEQNPVGYQLLAGDVVSIITSDTASDLIGITLYAVQQ